MSSDWDHLFLTFLYEYTKNVMAKEFRGFKLQKLQTWHRARGLLHRRSRRLSTKTQKQFHDSFAILFFHLRSHPFQYSYAFNYDFKEAERNYDTTNIISLDLILPTLIQRTTARSSANGSENPLPKNPIINSLAFFFSINCNQWTHKIDWTTAHFRHWVAVYQGNAMGSQQLD